MEENKKTAPKKKRDYYTKRETPVVTPSRAKRGQVSKEYMDENGNFDQNKYCMDYAKNAWDRIELRIVKGQREILRERADREGLSLMRYIINRIYHPIVVCKTPETHEYKAKTEKIADTLEGLLKENNIPYERDALNFSVNMEIEDIEKLINNFS